MKNKMNELIPNNISHNQKKALAYGLFLLVDTLIAFAFLMASPSDPKNAIFLGYSPERIVIGSAILIMEIIFFVLTLRMTRTPELAQKFWFIVFQKNNTSYKIFGLNIAIFAINWILLFLPPYRLGIVSSYFSRLIPISIAVLIASTFTAFIFFLENRPNKESVLFTDKKDSLLVFGTVFLITLLLSMCVFVTGVGVSHPADYWYGGGVPILGLQVLFSIMMGIVFSFFETNLNFNKKKIDILFFILIWIIAAALWAREPLSPNYFMPDTANNPLYPYSDSMTFDVGAQYSLLGQTLFNGIYFDRILYSVFLVYLHLFLGQDFNLLTTVQAVLFSVFPAIIYLIGKELHSRALGVSAACLLAIRGVNAIITSKWIDTASPKMMLTDFPTAIGIALFLLFLLRWSKQQNKSELLMLVGAMFGWTLMLRTHILVLLPVLFVLILFTTKKNFRYKFLCLGAVLIGLFAATAPWEIRNQSKGIPMFYMYYYRVELILRERYGIQIGNQQPLQRDINLAYLGKNTLFRHNRVQLQDRYDNCDTKLCSITNHFFHNYITSIVPFPVSLTYNDLWNTVKIKTPFWRKEWNNFNDVGSAGILLIIINQALISLGFASIWKRDRYQAVFPAVIFFSYIFVNSLALTSGGRYIVPVDWIIFIYYIMGGIQLVFWLLEKIQIRFEPSSLEIIEKTSSNTTQKIGWGQAKVLGILLVLGSFLPLSDFLSPLHYHNYTKNEILTKLDQERYLSQSGFTQNELLKFLSQPTAVIREGRILYPRYYPLNEGEMDKTTHYMILGYPRLVFTMIGPNKDIEGVILPGDQIKDFSIHAEDAVVLGCWNTTYNAPFIDAVVVFVTSGDGYVYTRSPGVPLQCPLPEPNP